MIENGRMQEVRSGKWLGRIEVVKGKLVAYPAGSEEAPVREDEVW